jgi:3',5'-cyclic AMP phosphodiesterase CpdA
MLESINSASPDLVVVGGDLTQRSRRSEWRRAAGWLGELNCDWIATPGNHDIPLFDFPRRALAPFGRYRQFIGNEMEPSATVGGSLVLCVRTAAPGRRVEGAVSRESLSLTRELLSAKGSRDPVILVTHHPLVAHAASGRSGTSVIRGDQLLQTAASRGVDLLLSGHTHMPWGGEAFGFEAGGRRLVAMHGGTACSTRQRAGEPPAWQLVDASPGSLSLESHVWREGSFQLRNRSGWTRSKEGDWSSLSGDD